MDEFQQARDDFFAEISEEERVQFSKIGSSKEFLEEFKKFEQFEKNKKKWTKVFKAVKACSEKLEPYFETLGIFVSSNPEYAAIAWGTFRLVLQMSCNFVTFFEKLGEMFTQLSSKIPAYNDVKKYAGKTISERFRASLKVFYVDLFEIFRGIARIFTQKSGKLRKTPVVIGQLLWQPFDVRFSSVLQRLGIHSEFLRLEMDVMHFQTSSLMAADQAKEQLRNEEFRSKMMEHNNLVCKMREDFDEIQTYSLFSRVKAWINPQQFVEAFNRSTKLRQDGTAEWIFDVETYQKWLQDPVDNTCDSMKKFFWIRGNPGTGKTILASSVVQELMTCDTTSPDSKPLVSYFFFDYAVPHMCYRDQAYRAILSRLLERFQRDNEILELFSFAMTKCNDGQLTATSDELLGLITILAARIDGWYIIIDAVDECEDSVDLLSELFRALADRPTKVLFFSRPNVKLLRQKMKTPQVLTISRSSVESDLRLFFDAQMQDLQESGIIPCDIQREELVECLITGADGMFQWARLMINHLQSEALMEWERISIIRKLTTPEKLEDMYIRILDLLAKKLTSEQSLARRLFLWLVFGKRTLSASQLQDILAPVKEGAGHPKEICLQKKKEEFADFEHRLVMVSGSLVEHRGYKDSQVDTYSFVHRSVIEFFKTNCENETVVCGSRPGSRGYFLPSSCEIEAELATSCLLYISQRVPGKPLSGDMFEPASGENLRSVLPFIDYAALYWPHHMMSMRISLSKLRGPSLDSFYQTVEKLLAIIGRFLLNKLLPMVWVEATYICEKRTASHVKIHGSLLQWAEWAQILDRSRLTEDSAEVPAAVAAFAEDLVKLHELWGETLLDGPNQIWHDVTAFTTSPFFVQTSAVTVKSLATESSNRSGLSIIPLSKISRDDPSTDFMAVLTIWPSRVFELSWRKSTPRQKYQPNAPQFDGWIAQYELWNVENEDPVVVDDSRISIDKIEVELQYQRFQKYVKSFSKTMGTQASKKELALHFPTSIGEGLNTITVLRTVFKRPQYMEPESSQFDASVKSWRQILMPIIHTTEYTLLQGPSERLRERETEDTKETKAFTQSYDTVLKFDRTPAFRMITYQNYVLYQSVEGCEVLSQDEDGAATIAVYQVANTKGADEIKLLGCIKGDGDQKQGSINHCVFHPTLPLLALHFRSTTGSSRILLWCFARKTASNSSSIVLLGQSLLQKKESFATSSVSTVTGRLKYIQFSACGEYVIFQTHDCSNPQTVWLQGLGGAYNIAVKYHSMSKGNFSQPARSFGKPEIEIQALQKPNSLPHAMSLNLPVLHGSGTSTTLSFNPDASNRSIKLVHSTDGLEEEQTLLSVPAWNDIGNISVSLRMPSKTREDKVSIRLNKTAQPFYTLSKGAEQTTPAVVRKDLRAIARPKVSNSFGSAKSQPSWRGIGFTEDRDDEEENRMKKRARITDSRAAIEGEGGRVMSLEDFSFD